MGYSKTFFIPEAKGFNPPTLAELQWQVAIVVNVPPVYPTWLPLFGCASVKTQFSPPLLTHTP